MLSSLSKLLAIQTHLKACLGKLFLPLIRGWWRRLTSRGGLGTGLLVVGDALEDDVLAPGTENEMPCTMGRI